MNLVAHQLLSFNQEELMIGNLLGEKVRAKDYENYPPKIAQGILLHRAIDSFTDTNPIVKNSTNLLHKSQGKYAPVVVDIMYDYLLIKNWNKFYHSDFQTFKQECYSNFKTHIEIFPESLKEMILYMIKEDWFENYSTLDGVSFTLTNMSRRRKYKNNLNNASKELYLYESELEQDFLKFFPQLVEYCNTFISNFKDVIPNNS